MTRRNTKRKGEARVRKALTKYVQKQTGWTPAKVKVEGGQVQIKVNPETKFAKCVKSVEKRGGAYDAKAVCASAGRKKYGAKKFAAMARKGKRKHNPSKYLVHVPATSKDAGYDIVVMATNAAGARAEAKRYCASRSGLGASYRLPKKTKVNKL